MSQPGCVRDIFEVSQRLRIGIGNARAMMFYTEFYNSFRREIIMPDLRWRDLRNLMVLTVQSAEVAARTGDGEALGARMEMIERFLLDGVDGQ